MTACLPMRGWARQSWADTGSARFASRLRQGHQAGPGKIRAKHIRGPRTCHSAQRHRAEAPLPAIRDYGERCVVVGASLQRCRPAQADREKTEESGSICSSTGGNGHSDGCDDSTDSNAQTRRSKTSSRRSRSMENNPGQKSSRGSRGSCNAAISRNSTVKNTGERRKPLPILFLPQ